MSRCPAGRGRQECLPHALGAVRRAFTLVEMLIAMVLTLILVYAIAEFYAFIGESVRDGRAMIEMGGQLRSAVERLKADLDLVTATAVPWADDGSAAGYIETSDGFAIPQSVPRGAPVSPIVFGAASDADANGNYRLDANAMNAAQPGPDAGTDRDGNTILDWQEAGVTSLIGDTDDWLGMTVRSTSAPFQGQMVQINQASGMLIASNNSVPLTKASNLPTSNPPLLANPIASALAEVVWWTSFADLDNDRFWDLNETRFLHRRQLLIRPDLNVIHSGDLAAGPYFCRIAVPASMTDPQAFYQYELFQVCDVSLRPAFISNSNLYFIANSLADLTKRENRFMHVAAFPFIGPLPNNFPNALDLYSNYVGTPNPGSGASDLYSPFPTQPRHAANNNQSQYRWVLYDGGRQGEDVLLSHLLAFDVRVYDPYAVLYADVTQAAINTGTAVPSNTLAPGDPGYVQAVAGQGGANAFAKIGTGAYVDLGYGATLFNMLQQPPFSLSAGTAATTLAPPGWFANPPTAVPPLYFQGSPAQPGSYYQGMPLAQYSAGSYFSPLPGMPSNYTPQQQLYHLTQLGLTYDTWSLSYERDGLNQNSGSGTTFDEGTDGLDNNGDGVVDDVGERETVPPYSYPLRGLEVKIRLYEPGTKQVRQATVRTDFISE